MVNNITMYDHSQGPENAPILVMYGDYECPDTRQVYQRVKKLQREFNNGFRFVYRHYPLTHSHPNAMKAAQAAVAADRQGKFWEMHERLFMRQKALADHDLRTYAEGLGLELARFDRDVASEEVHDRVREDIQSGQENGVRGTPSMFLNGTRYKGELWVEPLREVIRSQGSSG